MLRIVLGRAGAGKTRYAIEQAVGCGTQAVLLVPEQFTFEAEKRLLSRAGPSACLRVEVLSFKRLAHRVFGEYGGAARRYIGECGKYIVMRMALRQVADMLEVYRGQAVTASFVKTMVDAVAQYKVSGATPGLLGQVAEKVGNGLLRRKLSDLSLVFQTYEALLGQNLYDTADDLTVLAKTLEEHRFFEGKTVVIDSFKGFTPQERRVLARIIAQAEDVYATLCADALDGDGEGLNLFAPVQKTARQLIAEAHRAGVPVAKPVLLGAPQRFDTESLRFLEEHIFRGLGGTFEKDAPEIRLVSAAGLYDEAQFAAQSIAALVRETGCRYRDIVVIAGDPAVYRGIIDPAFEKYGVPLFLDARRAVDTHPLMVYVLSLFEAVLDNFRPGQVFRCLKTGLLDFTVEEISALENYALMWDIRGFDAWNMSFDKHPGGFGREMTAADKETLAGLNSIRERVMAPFAAFRRGLEQARSSGDFCRCVYTRLVQDGIEKRLPALCEQLRQDGELELADEYLRMWEALVGVLDQLALTLGGFGVSARDFYELLRLGISGCDIGHIPASLDEVTFGGAERIRTGEARYVFVLGLAEGMFPKSESTGGLFTRAERQKLQDAGLELAPSGREQAAEERFFAYKAFTCASRGVWLCCPRGDAAGRELRPSAFYEEVKKLFPGAVRVEDALQNELDSVQNEQSAFEALALGLRRGGELTAALEAYFQRDKTYLPRIEALQRAARREPFAFHDRQAARALYGENLRVSPSRVETQRQCRFAYFCRYGLNAFPRKKAELAAPEIGTLIHFVLERLLKTGQGGPENMADETLSARVRALLDEYARDYLGGLADKPERFRYLYEQLGRTVEELVRHIARELAQSEFVPVDFELRLAENGDVPPLTMPLADGGRLVVEGKVDRVDMMQNGEKTYLRVIDYKTGVKQFSLSDVAQGLNLQMLIYLFTLCRNAGARYGQGETLPAGVLYMPAKRPAITGGREMTPEKLRSETDKELKMNGLVLGDLEAVLGMEKDGAGIFIPVKLKAGGEEFLKSSSIASAEQLGAIYHSIQRKLQSMAKTLRSGDIAAKPVNGGGYDPCRYCDYADVCGFEPGDPVETLRSLSDEEAWGVMGAESEKNSTSE